MTTVPALREKLNPDGTYQPFAGNTIICHIDPKSEAFAALAEVHADIGKHSFSPKLSLLPTGSYHMTLFGGANDKHRFAPDWPADVAFDVPIADCHAEFERRLSAFDLGCEIPFRMRVSPDAVHEKEMALRLELQPLNDAENEKLRSLRDRLSQALAIRKPGHEDYSFHISLAYVIGAFTETERADYRAAYAGWRDLIATRSPVIELDAPEFCVFKDMLRFNRKLYLERR